MKGKDKTLLVFRSEYSGLLDKYKRKILIKDLEQETKKVLDEHCKDHLDKLVRDLSVR